MITIGACQSNNSEEITEAKTADTTQIEADTTTLEEVIVKAEINEQLNRFTQMLSGEPTAYKSDLSNRDIWLKYSKSTSAKWNKLQSKIALPIEQWVNTKGYNQKHPNRTLLYPFAGGDYFYAHLFFPNVDTIIMVGLEPPGYLFDPQKVSSEELSTYLYDLERSLFFPHKLGFFRTKSMAVDFKKGLLNGTLHTCLYYLSKFGNQIHYIKAIDFDENGDFSNEIDISNEKHGRKGYRIGYSTSTDKQVKELVYFAENLANSGVYRNGPNGKKIIIPAAKYFEKHKGSSAFFKAATYLMHKSYFSWIRNTCQNSCNIILQDDSGMKLESLKEAGYDVELLGEYTRTIPLFSNRFQEDLKEAYQSAQPERLPFNIGYNAQYGECNLQLATK